MVDQARISTAISELARNLYLYGESGEIIIERITNTVKVGVCVTAFYSGQDVSKRNQIVEDGFSSPSEVGIDSERVKRLMDDIEFQVDAVKGPFVKVQKWLD